MSMYSPHMIVCVFYYIYNEKHISDTLEELLITFRKSRSVVPRLILNKMSKKIWVRI